MGELNLAPPDKTSLTVEVQRWAAKAHALIIASREDCVNVSYLLRSIKGVMDDIDTVFAPEVEKLAADKRAAEAKRKEKQNEIDAIKAPLVQAEPIIKRKLLDFEQEQERVRLAEERRLQLVAQREAEAVTLAVAADLELQAAATGDAEMLAEAHSILSQPIEAPTVSVKTAMPKVQGIVYKGQWKAHPQIDVKALAAAVGRGDAPESFLQPNVTALNQWARATEGKTVPGVRFFYDRNIAARG